MCGLLHENIVSGMDCSGTLDVAGAANCEDAVNERCTKDTAEQLLVS